MKKAAIFSMTVAMTTSMALVVNATTDEIRIRVDGEFISTGDVAPTIVEGRTLVPLGAVMEQLGFAVGWDDSPNARAVFLTMDGVPDIMLPLDNRPRTSIFPSSDNATHLLGQMYTGDGRIYQLDVSPRLISGRTMVPVAAISQAAGMEVEWDGENRIVDIITGREDAVQPVAEIPVGERIQLSNRRQTEAERAAWIAEYWALGGVTDFEREVIAAVNAVRVAHNLVPLTLDYGNSMASRLYAQQLATLPIPFGHREGPYGGSNGVVESFGFRWNAVNASAGRTSASQTVDDWMDSPVHRANILNADLRNIGVGSFEGGEWGIYTYSVMSIQPTNFQRP